MFDKLRSWGKSNREAELNHLEQMLEDSYRTVEPSPEYLSGLRKRLANLSPKSDQKPLPIESLDKAAFTAAITADAVLTSLGLLTGAAVLIVGIRAAIALLAAVGIARQVKSGLKTEHFTSQARRMVS